MVVHVPSAFVTLSYAIVHHGGRVILQVQTLLPQRRSFGLAENVCALAFISHSFRDRGSRNHLSSIYLLINRQCMLSDVDGRWCMLSGVQLDSLYIHLQMACG